MIVRSLQHALVALLALFLTACAHGPESTSSARLRFIGETTLPHKMLFQGTVVGGISGIDFDPRTQTWYLLADDRSDHNPARFYTAKMEITADAFKSVTLASTRPLKQPNHAVFPSSKSNGEVADPESIRYRAESNTLLWTSEGDKKLSLSPFVREMTLDGVFVREWARLPMFELRPANAERQGPRDNTTFEGFTLSPDGSRGWVAMEGPLIQDGEMAKVGTPAGPARFTEFDVQSGQPVRQIAYQADAIPRPPVPATAFADNGIPEVLMVSATRMLVLERAFMSGVGTSIRLYEIDTSSGSDVLKTPALKGGDFTPVAKRLLLDFDTIPGLRTDNIEAMGFGPRLPNGNRTLVFASDDNLSARQVTQFVAFEVIE